VLRVENPFFYDKTAGFEFMPPVGCQPSRFVYPEDGGGKLPLNLITGTPIQLFPKPTRLEFLTL